MSRTCDGKTEVFSRVTGFYRPVQQYNNGKREEYRQRREYVVGPQMKEQNDGQDEE